MYNPKYVYVISGIFVTFVGIDFVIFSLSSASADDIFVPLITQDESSISNVGIEDSNSTNRIPTEIPRPEKMLPPAPTPSHAPNQEQLDREQEERRNPPTPASLPTSTSAPNATPIVLPTIEPRPTPTERPIRVVEFPSSKVTRYVDPDFGFSFEYPENWSISAPAGAGRDLSRGSEMSIANYDLRSQPTIKPHKSAPGELSINISLRLYSGGSQTEDISKWIQTRFHPETKFTFISQDEKREY